MSLLRFFFRSFFLLTIGFGAFQSVSAQISVTIEPERHVYVAHEAVTVIITVVNRTGKDITLRGPAPGIGWLNFTVSDAKGVNITPRRGAPIAGPEVLSSSAPLRFSVNLNEVYPVNRFGVYRASASVYNPDSNAADPAMRYSSSATTAIRIDEADPVWQELATTPDGLQRYSLLKYRDMDKTLLYFRLMDEKTGMIRRTYKLGSMVQFLRPQAVLDSSGNLQVLYQAAPRQFLHVSIGSDGEFLKQQVYDEEKGDRPKLMQNSSGQVTVSGGVDPDLRKRQNREKLGEMSRIRKLSDRPPGF